MFPVGTASLATPSDRSFRQSTLREPRGLLHEAREDKPMVRFRFMRHVPLGHSAQALEAAEEISAVQRVRGWPEGTHRIVVGGPSTR